MTPIIETERLILRHINPETDFEGWAEMMADPDTMRYLSGDPLNRALAWRNMCLVIGHQQVRGYSFFSVIEKTTKAWVGRVGPWAPEGWVQPEIGWAIHPAHTRKGYATEAGAGCIKYAFETLGWREVAHVIHHENVASMKTAEKLGSCKIKDLEGIPGVTDAPCFLYGQKR